MAAKEIDFVIKINNKEVDLSKTSFEQFNKIVKDAKKELQSLPLSDPNYKKLQTDINGAEDAWKKATKSAKDFGQQTTVDTEGVKSYTQQIRVATKELVAIEQEFGKTSKQYSDQQQKIKDLRVQQEEFSNSTKKLEDSLAAIPGPIGKIGGAFQEIKIVGQSAGSALKGLGADFTTFDGLLKATGIGLIISLVALLVAAIDKASKSFKPLQDAFASIQDAVGQLFIALKPVTDFLLNVFVSVVNGVAKAISYVAELFGAVDNGLAKEQLSLERRQKEIEQRLQSAAGLYSDYFKQLLEIDKQYYTDKQAIDKNADLTDDERVKQKFVREVQYNKDIKDFRQKALTDDLKIKAKNQKEISDLENELIEIQRQREIKKLEIQQKFDKDNNKQVTKELQNRYDNQKEAANKLGGLDKEAALLQLTYIKRDLDHQKDVELKTNAANAEAIKEQKKQFTLEDLAATNEAQLKINELTDGLIKDEYERNVKLAKDDRQRKVEEQRKEIEDIKKNFGEQSVEYKAAKQRQGAELAVEDEKIRKAELERDASKYEKDIVLLDNQFEKLSAGTIKYYKNRTERIKDEYNKEFELADGNAEKELQAATNRDKALKDLANQQIEERLNLEQRKADTLEKLTFGYYEAQRNAENDRYAEAVKQAGDNNDLLATLKAEHIKKMKDLNKMEVEDFVQVGQQILGAVGNIYGQMQQVNQLQEQNELSHAQGNAAQQDQIKRKYFEKNKQAQIGETIISTLQASVNAYESLAVIPIVGPVLGAAAAAAALVFGYEKVAAIKATQYESSNTAATQTRLKNYGSGGVIDGKSHGEGGQLINAEGGEAIINKQSVAMFKPMLSMMNQMGGGTSFQKGIAGQAGYDNPKTTSQQPQDQPIFKTYVVENELTTMQARQSRLKELSTL